MLYLFVVNMISYALRVCYGCLLGIFLILDTISESDRALCHLMR